jgi:hypothetical protein
MAAQTTAYILGAVTIRPPFEPDARPSRRRYVV